MIRYTFGGAEPEIDPHATVETDVVVIGDVTIGAHSVIGSRAVLRADDAPISIGDGVVIGPRCVVHVTPGRPTTIDSSAIIGTAVHIEGCHIMASAVIGDGAIVLAGAVVGLGAVVAPRSTVTSGTIIEAGRRVAGTPATNGSAH